MSIFYWVIHRGSCVHLRNPIHYQPNINCCCENLCRVGLLFFVESCPWRFDMSCLFVVHSNWGHRGPDPSFLSKFVASCRRTGCLGRSAMAWYQTAHHHSKCWDLSSLHETELLSANDLITCYSTAKAAKLKDCCCSFARQGYQNADSTSAIAIAIANYSMPNYCHCCSNSRCTFFCRICLFA